MWWEIIFSGSFKENGENCHRREGREDYWGSAGKVAWNNIHYRLKGTILTQSFSRIPVLRVTRPPDYIRHTYYKYYVFVRPEYLKPNWSRDRIIETLNTKGIPYFSGSCGEIYLEKAFESSGLQPSTRLPVAKELGETSPFLAILYPPFLWRACPPFLWRAVLGKKSFPNHHSPYRF